MADKEIKQTPALDPATMEMVKQMVTTMVQELKRDPDLEAKKSQALAQRQQMQKSQEDFREQQAETQRRCNHRRIDGSYCIGWMPYADNVPRGVCQICTVLVDPTHIDYEHLLKFSTQGYTLSLR
jgi:hypothetical protein